LIGEIEIGANCSIWFSTVLRGDGPGIRIGENSNLQEGPVAMSPRAAVVTTAGCGGGEPGHGRGRRCGDAAQDRALRQAVGRQSGSEGCAT
jgi:hypothetical protein